ncbi:neutral/alkaline non-lysosomal ceramidase N-terminal domain-containing protein [Paenibacillus sp. GCM10027626]|uniref:neutral/alkaline non-lysosomal ceramidase N-terminal domain-containing protein n=1 Tax=Paenibacillus sp. GCM10027626 TaxID=3273411 RepID=UPI0036394957
MTIELGTAKLDITPTAAVPLAGFAHRKDRTAEVRRPLHVRAWLFRQRSGSETKHALLLQADLIWWGTAHVQSMKQVIARKWGIARDCIMFHASHTHGGPQTTGEFSPELGVMDSSYIMFLEQKVHEAVAAAHEQLEEVTMQLGMGSCEGIGVNRRKIVKGEAAFAPNPSGPHDHTVTVIRCLTADGRTKGLLFHFTCHPTTTSANRVDAEYCGVAMERLDAIYGAGASCFLQGCCGDIRPHLERDGQFYSGGDEEVIQAGERLAGAVATVLQGAMKPLEPAPLEGKTVQAALPFRETPLDVTHPPLKEPDPITAVWRSLKRAGRLVPEKGLTLDIQLLVLAKELALLAMNGEMVVEYGLWIKQQSSSTILPLGYSNGMVGYVPVARQLAEGGYEGATSGFAFSYPAQLDPAAELNIKTAIGELLAPHD